MRRLIVCGALISFLFTMALSDIFAAKRPDWGWSPNIYEYAIVAGEVASVDLKSNRIRFADADTEVFFNDETRFYAGDVGMGIEKVYGGPTLSEKQRISPKAITNGKLMKCTFTRSNDGKIYLNTCLVEE